MAQYKESELSARNWHANERMPKMRDEPNYCVLVIAARHALGQLSSDSRAFAFDAPSPNANTRRALVRARTLGAN